MFILFYMLYLTVGSWMLCFVGKHRQSLIMVIFGGCLSKVSSRRPSNVLHKSVGTINNAQFHREMCSISNYLWLFCLNNHSIDELLVWLLRILLFLNIQWTPQKEFDYFVRPISLSSDQFSFCFHCPAGNAAEHVVIGSANNTSPGAFSA